MKVQNLKGGGREIRARKRKVTWKVMRASETAARKDGVEEMEKIRERDLASWDETASEKRFKKSVILL